MIEAKFQKKDGDFHAFEISGHAGFADRGYDVVCAAVSSAVQLVVNILNELGCAPAAEAENDTVRCRITASEKTASAVIGQFVRHIEAIAEEFPKTINITISEV